MDTAFPAPDEKIYFFVGKFYHKYNARSKNLEKRSLIANSTDGFNRLVSDVDAALIHPQNKRGYIFKGTVYYRLKNPENLRIMDKEMIDGHLCSRCRKERILSWEPPPDNVMITDYWINEDKIRIKMSYTGPGVNGMLETTNINLSNQPEYLFVPPSNYKKAGNIITWKEEKMKYDKQKKGTEPNKQ